MYDIPLPCLNLFLFSQAPDLRKYISRQTVLGRIQFFSAGGSLLCSSASHALGQTHQLVPHSIIICAAPSCLLLLSWNLLLHAANHYAPSSGFVLALLADITGSFPWEVQQLPVWMWASHSVCKSLKSEWTCRAVYGCWIIAIRSR